METIVMTGPTILTQQPSGHIMIRIFHFARQVGARKIGDSKVIAEYLLCNAFCSIHIDWLLWAHDWAVWSTAVRALDVQFPKPFTCSGGAFDHAQRVIPWRRNNIQNVSRVIKSKRHPTTWYDHDQG